MMSPIENLHYAIGEMAYAVARADGEVQKEEREKFHDIVAAELRCENYGFDISDIIFKILDKEKESVETSYDWAIKQIRLNSHYLSPELKNTFIKVMEKIAEAFPPVTKDELKLIDRFRKDIEPLHGDPVYYQKISQSKKKNK
jgi:uncharacterized tellurite resistance protein B-like protein